MRLLISLLLISCSISSFAESMSSSSQLVNNRILAKINGNAISVCDLLKKMDMIYFKENKDHIDSTATRIEFYEAHWQHVLSDLIDRELIMADAEEKGLKVNQGDVREEIEEIFGPNILENLDKIDLSFEDVWKMTESDIIIRRMLYMSVNSKALAQATPQDVRVAYDQYVQDERDHQQFVFRIISVKGATEDLTRKTAEQAYALLTLERASEEEVKSKLNKDGITVSFSTPYTQEKKDMNTEIYSLLSFIPPGAASCPKEVRDNGYAFRLMQLVERSELNIQPFTEIEEQLKNLVIRRNQMKETQGYFSKLRKYYNVKEENIIRELPSQFLSFMLHK